MSQPHYFLTSIGRITTMLLTLWLSPAIAATAAVKPPQAGIATAHPLATEAGLKILAQGGNAFDAAVTVTAVLAVVEPTGSGLGGGGFWLLHRADDGFETMLDGRETAPAAAHRDMYLDDHGEVIDGLSVDGPLSAGIPGIPAGMVHLAKKYGRLTLAQTLAPAIQLAREGFAVSEHYRRMASFRLKALQASPAAAAQFLQPATPQAEGTARQVPEVGYLIRQPALAKTLQAIADQGKAGFYRGPVAKKLVDGVQAAGGIWTLSDLSNYRVIEREPIRSTYRSPRGEMQITSAAPPSSGGIALATLFNILSGLELDKQDHVTRTHLIVEAMRRAYRDRAEYLGDPDFTDIPTERLLHPYYAAGLRAAIRRDKALPSAYLPGIKTSPKGRDTTHFSILDRDGNRVSATLTVNYPFGSGFVAPGTGVLLNDEMDDFSAKPGTPNVYGLVGGEANAIAPGKRPLSSMSPSFLQTARGIAVVGTPGGSRIITMLLLAALDFDAGGDAQSMVSQARFHHQYLPDVLQYETAALSKKDVAELEQRGHTLREFSHGWGNMQAVVWDKKRNEISVAADPRVEGSAATQ